MAEEIHLYVSDIENYFKYSHSEDWKKSIRSCWKHRNLQKMKNND